MRRRTPLWAVYEVCLALILVSIVSRANAATIAVPVGGDFQAALNAATAGDVIMLAAGATYVGNFILPYKGAIAQPIVVRSAANDALLPPGGVRMTPAYASLLPKIKSPNGAPAVRTEAAANHWTLMWLEFQSTQNGIGEIIALGAGDWSQTQLWQVPYQLVIDRVYVHGDAAVGQTRGIGLNSRDTTIVNSYVSDCKSSSQDSQAIGGFNGPGNYLIENNYLEGSGENFMLGGGDPPIQNLVTSNVTFRRNHLAKPLAWRNTSWIVKNLLELKNAQDVLIEGNVFENLWVAAQAGYAIVLTPRNQDGNAPWAVVQRVTFRYNMVRHTAGGINILGTDDNHPSQRTNHLTISQNVFDDLTGAIWGGSRPFQVGEGADSVTIDHNTIITTAPIILALYGGTPTSPLPMTNFVYTNNMSAHNDYGIFGNAIGVGLTAIGAYLPGGLVTRNVLAGGIAAQYPAGNLFPAPATWQSAFIGYATADYRLAPGGAFKNAATDGTDLGPNIDIVNALIGVALSGIIDDRPPPPPGSPRFVP